MKAKFLAQLQAIFGAVHQSYTKGHELCLVKELLQAHRNLPRQPSIKILLGQVHKQGLKKIGEDSCQQDVVQKLRFRSLVLS